MIKKRAAELTVLWAAAALVVALTILAWTSCVPVVQLNKKPKQPSQKEKVCEDCHGDYHNLVRSTAKPSTAP